MGSSPRVRGEVSSPWQALLGRRDHPRGCGEKDFTMLDEELKGGSSPRVRGEARVEAVGEEPAGIIPAGAGRRPARRTSRCRR